MKTANINQLFEYYFILLIGFLFYENVVFNETIESGLEYTLTIMMILIIFILGRKLKPIPIHNLTLFLKSMLLICSLFFFSIGIQLPMEIQEFGLNHWIFSTAINILMIGVLIGIIPLLLLQLQVYSHTSELESKEQVGKLMEVSFRMPMTFLIIGVFGNWSLLAIPIDDASYIIPMGLSIIGLVMMFYIDKIPYRTGEKKQESKTQFQLDMLQYLQFLFRIVLVPVFIFSSLDHDIFQFEIIFFIGIGATVYEMMAKIFKQNKISRNTTDRILTLFCFLLLFSTNMLRLDEYLNGANIQTHYGFNLIILGIFSQNLYHYLIAFINTIETPIIKENVKITLPIPIPHPKHEELMVQFVIVILMILSIIQIALNEWFFVVGIAIGICGFIIEAFQATRRNP